MTTQTFVEHYNGDVRDSVSLTLELGLKPGSLHRGIQSQLQT